MLASLKKLVALAVVGAAVVCAAPAKVTMPDLALIEMQMPVDLAESPEGMTPEAVAKLHETAGSFADDAIKEAMHQSMLMETDSIAAAAGGASKWDDSVPEIHLKMNRPEELLSTELETVDHLDHVRPSLTQELVSPQMMAQQLAMVGQDHSMIQQQSQAQTVQAVATQAVADSNADSEVHATVVAESSVDMDTATLSESEAQAGVLTMSELKQMMELEGMSQAEIDQYMQNLAEVSLTAETEAEQETQQETEMETEQEQSTEQEVEQESDQESDQPELVEVESEEPVAEESASEEAAPEAEALVEEAAEEAPVAEEAAMEEAAPALVEEAGAAETEGQAETEGEAEAEAVTTAAADADVSVEADAELGADAAAAAETQSSAAPAPQSADETIHLADHPAPAQLLESVPSSVTPIHSRAYAKRHPALRRMASAPVGAQGYSLPQADQAPAARRAAPRDQSLMEVRSRSRQRARDLDLEKFNPNAIQLGPSKDIYGYQPMTGDEFLHAAGAPLSLAQINMAAQHQQGSWLPPPLESEAVPNYVVGVGGLQMNRNAGPYAGQYGLATGGQPLAQEPQVSFIQY